MTKAQKEAEAKAKEEKAQKEAEAKKPKKGGKVKVVLLCNYGKEKPNATIETDDLTATSLVDSGLAKKV